MPETMSQQRFIAILALLLGFTPAAWARESPTTSPAPTTAPAGQVIDGIAVDHLGAGIAGATVRIESLDAAEDDPPLATATTGRTGDIHLQLPKRVEASVRARIIKEGYATLLQEIDLTDESQPPWIDATLDGAAKLSGVIRDRLFNEPVKGATISCESGGQTFTAITDAQGRYNFNTIALGPVGIQVTAKGFGVERKAVRVLELEAQLDFELGPERKVELRFITDDEKPATDLRVDGITRPGNAYLTTTTGPDGKVTLGGISDDAGEVLLRANGPRYVQMHGFDIRLDLYADIPESKDGQPPASMPAVRREFTVHIASRLKGTVTDAKTGEPIVGVRVIAGREFRSDAPMTWTNLDGTYELPGLPPGLNVISYQHGQYATTIKEIHLDQEQTVTTDMRLNPGQVLGGKVVDNDGQPVEQVFVSGDDWQGHSTLGLRAITDKDGMFSFSNAPEGEIVFNFVKPGCALPVTETLKSGKSDYRIVLDTGSSAADAQPPAPRAPKVELGKPVPDMTLVALDGATYRLSDMRGKYVMLDIWATWCGPCMAEIDHVKALRLAMKDRADFVLIGVSLDTDRENLKAAIGQHGIDWPQVFGPRSGAREAFEMLSGVAIPYTGLIGPDGTLLAQDLRGEKLVEAVKAEMAKTRTTKPAP